MKTVEKFLRDELNKRLIRGTKKLHEWDYDLSTEEIMKLIKDYSNLVIEEAANEAMTTYIPPIGSIVDQNSILKIKEKL